MRSQIATLMTAVLAAATPLAGQIGQEIHPAPVRPDAPVTRPVPAAPSPGAEQGVHVVRTGDTLWDLAGQYYSNPYTWPTIFDANRDVVEDAHWIYPGERLRIPGVPTSIAEGPPSAPGEIRPLGQGEQVAMAGSTDRVPLTRHTRFYDASRNGGPTVIGSDRVPTAGVEPGEHYAAPWLADPAQLPMVGALLRSVDSPSSGADDDMMVHPYDQLYVEYGGPTRPRPGEKLIAVRVGEAQGGGGRKVIHPTGIVTVVATEADVMTVQVTEQWRPMHRGNLVLPLEPFTAVVGDYAPMNDGPTGKIVGWEVDQPLYDMSNHGFLDLGARDGVELGDMLQAYRAATVTSDSRVPAAPVALLKIVRVDDDVSTFRVVKVMQRELAAGMAVRVVSRVP